MTTSFSIPIKLLADIESVGAIACKCMAHAEQVGGVTFDRVTSNHAGN